MPKIIALIRHDTMGAGTRLPELMLARRLQVSRTPVRSALAQLAQQEVVLRTDRGYVVGKPHALDRIEADLSASGALEQGEELPLLIARDRLADTLPAEVSEADLMRRYGVGRATVQRTLTQLAGLGVVERRAGHGWAFLPAITTATARAESYRFRQLIEPAMLLEPGYRLDPDWIKRTRARHQGMLHRSPHDAGSVAFYEMNAAFHEGLAIGSGNRFFVLAVQQQNRLRRLSNYEWGHMQHRGAVELRIRQNVSEHIEILDRLERGEGEIASALMRRHLHYAQLVRP